MKSRFLVYFAFVIGVMFALPVAADPIAGYDQTTPVSSATAQSPRSTATSPRTGRATPSPAAAKAGATTTATSRAVGSRSTASRPAAETSRNVAARPANIARTADNRAVRARTGETPASSRVGVVGPAIRASTGTSISSLANRLYTGSYSNIIDPTTGLISADAYSNCLESYYACMDEICTARNPGQRRCACAGRVKTFNNVEGQLQQAREDLLRVSGELSLLIASKGKEIISAFTLTDAEKTLNCVSWREAKINKTTGLWCYNHMVAGTTTSGSGVNATHTCPSGYEPQYCSAEVSAGGLGLGMNWEQILNGADSDILASLKTYASTIDQVNVITTNDNGNLFTSFMNVNDIVNQLGDINIFNTTETSADFLARLWGYNLFQYAHNNVCNRVLDSCFNGIYEACGTPKNGQKCANGQAQCPFNYNSIISVNNDGNDLNFVNPGDTYTNTASATCYGYTTTSGDPYTTLRRPVADARRSVVQKYALDANADCDLYGEELKRQAQNMAYQKIAATQLLQNKRLEFRMEEDEAFVRESNAAKTNFSECLSEVFECYLTQEVANPSWTTSRIKTYCAQIASIPRCYTTMICNPPNSNLAAVIDVPDAQTCTDSQDPRENNCRNVVTLNEILNGMAGTAYPNGTSAKNREACLLSQFVQDIRDWKRWTDNCPLPTTAGGMGGFHPTATGCRCPNSNENWDGTTCCPSGTSVSGIGGNHPTATGCKCFNNNTSWNGSMCVANP
ncbi:MAG: hypothetical protein FWE50_03365 [Alphaproteobacteria bacterium]|nr:hypothetical protein [Alphaproteobacteria bacterium]